MHIYAVQHSVHTILALYFSLALSKGSRPQVRPAPREDRLRGCDRRRRMFCTKDPPWPLVMRQLRMGMLRERMAWLPSSVRGRWCMKSCRSTVSTMSRGWGDVLDWDDVTSFRTSFLLSLNRQQSSNAPPPSPCPRSSLTHALRCFIAQPNPMPHACSCATIWL